MKTDWIGFYFNCLFFIISRGQQVTEILRGAEIFVRSLIDEGVEFVFGYPGGAVLHIYDALFQQDKVKHILVRHEQGATMLRTGMQGLLDELA